MQAYNVTSIHHTKDHATDVSCRTIPGSMRGGSCGCFCFTCLQVNMNGTALYEAVTVIFIAQVWRMGGGRLREALLLFCSQQKPHNAPD